MPEFHSLTQKARKLFMPKAFAQNAILDFIDEQYDFAASFWPKDVVYKKTDKGGYIVPTDRQFPESPASLPQKLDGVIENSSRSLQLSNIKAKWLSAEFAAKVGEKLRNLEKACDFPEGSLRTNEFDVLQAFAKNAQNNDNERISLNLVIEVRVDGLKPTKDKMFPAPQQ